MNSKADRKPFVTVSGLALLALLGCCCWPILTSDVSEPTVSAPEKQTAKVGVSYPMELAGMSCKVKLARKDVGSVVVFEVTIPDMPDEDTLRALATELRDKTTGDFKRTVVGFHVQSERDGYQARAEFTPQLELTIPTEGELLPRDFNAPTAPLESAPYRVIMGDAIPGLKVSMDVILDERVNEEELRRLALELKSKHPGFERTFIGYHVGEKQEHGFWASTHFTPELKVIVYGQEKEAHEAAKAQPKLPDGAQLVGHWIDPRPIVSGPIVIYKLTGKYYVRQTFQDGSESKHAVKRKRAKRGMRFKGPDTSGTGDHYIVNKSGDLEMWDNDGKIVTARPPESK